MLRYTVRRLLLLIPILLGLSILVFFWVRNLPGGPAEALLGERATPETVAQIERQYGLDQPLPVQYWRYLKNIVQGEFGDVDEDTSPGRSRSSGSASPRRSSSRSPPASSPLIFGVPLGFLAAKHYQGPADHASLVVTLIGISTPIFFLALILKYIFAVRLGWLPSVGRISVLIDLDHPTNFYVLDAIIAGNWNAFVDTIKHLILPAIALASIPLAIIARVTRASVLDVQNEDYVRTARAKGVAPMTVNHRHVLRNAMLPIATIIGLQVGLLLSGAVLTETVFAFPGIGSWLVEAIKARDYPVIQGGLLFVAVIVVFVNLFVDLSYGVLNPRIRLSK